MVSVSSAVQSGPNATLAAHHGHHLSQQVLAIEGNCAGMGVYAGFSTEVSTKLVVQDFIRLGALSPVGMGTEC
jgi:hypothetical protein